MDYMLSNTVFETLTHKSRKWLVFRTRPLFDALLRGSSSEFLDETFPAKTRGILESTVRWKLHNPNFNWLTWYADAIQHRSSVRLYVWRTDERALHICCHALKTNLYFVVVAGQTISLSAWLGHIKNNTVWWFLYRSHSMEKAAISAVRSWVSEWAILRFGIFGLVFFSTCSKLCMCIFL